MDSNLPARSIRYWQEGDAGAVRLARLAFLDGLLARRGPLALVPEGVHRLRRSLALLSRSAGRAAASHRARLFRR